MTPQEEKQVYQLLELVSSLSKLVNDMRVTVTELSHQNLELLAQLEAVRAIAKAKL